MPGRAAGAAAHACPHQQRPQDQEVGPVDPVGQARPDWMILRDLAQRFGVPEGYGHVGDVTDEIARALPSHAELTWQALGPSAATAPTPKRNSNR